MTLIGRSLVLAGVVAGSVAADAPRTSLAQGLPPCGTVTADTKLEADCLAPLTVAADDVTVNLGGHQVSCVGGTGIDVSDRWDVRIEKGQVNNCALAVLLSGGGGHTVRRLQITSAQGVGVVIDDSDDNLLQHVRVTGVRAFGVRVSGNNNRLESNELSGIVANGGTAILLLEGATDTAVRLNLLHNNALGIQVGGSANVVQANQANHNQVGINVDGSANTIRANGADDNALGGIQVGAGGTDNLLRGNRARRNGVYDLADFPDGPCTLNEWKANRGERLLDGCETG